MSLHLEKAILARLRGTEVLTGALLAQQQVTNAIKWRQGTLTEAGEIPCGLFYFDAGTDAMPNAPDVGIIENVVVRFEVWQKTRVGSYFGVIVNALEILFDERRGAPELTLENDGKVFNVSLFVGFQGPFRDDGINAHYCTISFVFIEARP